jgi:quercetin dioxygenase-like cupin family protein
MAPPRASIVPLDQLPHARHSHEFVGADHGDVPFSIILVHSRPGAGPAVHTHPYAEVFVVDSGQATFVLGARQSSSRPATSSSGQRTCPTGSRIPGPGSSA